ncbi:hypothetical protein [Actinomyces sp.]|uniref:hypothetical protein n=1 Tax=Actinomyces sp. TaxID=29317 RepID=UPI00289F1E98|nr:hypothetical protein [Actinomyces sp.]
MPTIRVELTSTREEGRRILALHHSGAHHRPGEEAAIEQAWKQGRTPTGAVHFAGLTNGQPPRLKYDVTVHPDIADIR